MEHKFLVVTRRSRMVICRLCADKQTQFLPPAEYSKGEGKKKEEFKRQSLVVFVAPIPPSVTFLRYAFASCDGGLGLRARDLQLGAEDLRLTAGLLLLTETCFSSV